MVKGVHLNNCKGKAERNIVVQAVGGSAVGAHTEVVHLMSRFVALVLDRQTCAEVDSTCLVADSSLSIDRIRQCREVSHQLRLKLGY